MKVFEDGGDGTGELMARYGTLETRLQPRVLHSTDRLAVSYCYSLQFVLHISSYAAFTCTVEQINPAVSIAEISRPSSINCMRDRTCARPVFDCYSTRHDYDTHTTSHESPTTLTLQPEQAPVNTACVVKKHCRAMLFISTAREHGSCEQHTCVHGPCRRYINQWENFFYFFQHWE